MAAFATGLQPFRRSRGDCSVVPAVIPVVIVIPVVPVVVGQDGGRGGGGRGGGFIGERRAGAQEPQTGQGQGDGEGFPVLYLVLLARSISLTLQGSWVSMRARGAPDEWALIWRADTKLPLF